MISPMLAKPYDPTKLRFPVYSQPKLDGLRCIATKDGLFSRAGNQFRSCPHIEKALRPAFLQNPLLILDGELYAESHVNNFPELCGIIKRTTITPEVLERSSQIQFWMFDTIVLDDPRMPFKDREAALYTLPVPWSADEPLRLLRSALCQTPEEVDSFYDSYITNGRYEGQIIRLNMPYSFKRTSHLLKRKPSEKDVFIIHSILEGDGKWRHMAGAFEMATSEGRLFSAALADDDSERRRLWLEKDTLIGRRAEVVYQKLLPSGVPRHPRIKSILP